MTEIVNRDFNFENKVFDAPGAHFARSPGSKEPLYFVQLGDNMVSLQFESIRNNFDIEKGSEDDRLLNLVVSSLQFIKRIRPGDSIPSEVLDGTASWAIEDRHRNMVEIRLTVALAQWITGETETSFDISKIMALADDPETKKKAQEGIQKIAESMGLDKSQHQEIVNKIEQLKDELAYIEALKQRFQGIKMISDKMKAAQSRFSDDKTLKEEISRIQILLSEPMKRYGSLFRLLDQESSDVYNLIKNFSVKVDLIRRTRDDLRSALLDWEEMIQQWEDQVLEPDCGVEALVRGTYRFVATNFPMSQNWRSG